MKTPLGIFDSGIGGMTLLPAIASLLPHENILYVADEAYSPYGEKSQKELLERTRIITQQLIAEGCKLIVVACNTATTQVIEQLRNEFSLPFVGIEPGIKPAAQHSKSGVIGVLATQGTLNSPMYLKLVTQFKNEIKVVEQIGHGLVNCIEDNKMDSSETRARLTNFLAPMLTAGIDTLLLGCTHYPFLIPLLKELLPEQVTIMDNSAAIARQIKRTLTKHNIVNRSKTKGITHFYSTQKNNRLVNFVVQEVTHLPL